MPQKNYFDKTISLYTNAKDNKGTTSTIYITLEQIKSGINPIDELVKLIRAASDAKEITSLKKKLYGVTFSGHFSTRKAEALIEHSGYICMDIDKLKPEDVKPLKSQFAQDEYVVACFVSPSGLGLKVLFNIAIGVGVHLDYFHALTTYIVNTYGVEVDITGKDVNRLCFLSHDPDIYIAEKYTLVDDTFIQEQLIGAVSKQIAPVDNPEPVGSVSGSDFLKLCDTITRRSYQPQRGSYNHYIVTFSIFANRYGISQDTVIHELKYTCAEHDVFETETSVKAVYKNFASEAGKWLATFKKGKQKKAEAKPKEAAKNTSEVNDKVLFWYSVLNEKTGKDEYKFSYDDAIEFLHNNGFYRYSLDNGYYQFIRIKEALKQVEVIQPIQIKDFILQYLKSQNNGEFKAVREMFRRGAKNYCSINLLEGLDYKKPILKRDTKEEAFMYFNNCYLRITKEGIQELSYTSLNEYIWSKQVIDFEYKKMEYANSDFNLFATYAILGKKVPVTEWEESDVTKMESFTTTIGYLLHRFKNPALTKAVVAVDKRLRSHGENNGRTGKSLLSKALAKMLNVCLIDGKNFKFDSPFPFQKANIDTELINFNDVLKNFDFERLFGLITEEFTFEKKGKDSITLSFEDSPKYYISTNTTLKGSGESNKGRQQVIEFSSYFNTEHTPAKEFGRMFFSDWDTIEYCKFYNFMTHALQYYLENGLIDFPLENYHVNKLIDSAGEEFIDYMNETIKEHLQHNQKFEVKKLYEGFINENKNKEKLHIKTFNRWVRMWADISNLCINAHKNGERDRSNGVDYFTFTYSQDLIIDDLFL